MIRLSGNNIGQAPFAAIDVGSNAIRLFIARDQRGVAKPLADLRVPLRLGKDSFTRGLITPATTARLIETFEHFRSLCRSHQVAQVRAVATSAFRDAKNRTTVVGQIWRATGLVIEVIDGLDEARLIHSAVCRTYNLGRRQALMLDMGGGSLEVIHSSSGRIQCMASLPLGTVRLLGKVGKEARYEDYARAARREIAALCERHVQLESLIMEDVLIATGGSARALSRISHCINPKSRRNLITHEDLEATADALFSMSRVRRAETFGLKADRVDVILPAAAIVLETLRALNYPALHVPNVGLKNGIFWQMSDQVRRDLGLKRKRNNPCEELYL